jgi:aspartate/tyrosine/aromatic aminotransferase
MVFKIFKKAFDKTGKKLKELLGGGGENVFIGKQLVAYIKTPNWKTYKRIFEEYGFKTKNIDEYLLVFKPHADEKQVEKEFQELLKTWKEGKLEKLLAQALSV